MTLEQYLQLKEVRSKTVRSSRPRCTRCKKPLITCYCSAIESFSSNPRFVILMHKAEAKRSIATGRMAHLCLSNSLLFQGTDYSEHEGVNALISDPKNYCMVLSPGRNSVNLTELRNSQRKKLFPKDKHLVLFVIDGTWAQAKRMKRLSQNLSTLPTICFTPNTPSMFLVRQQPEENCYSTIEAIHHCLELIGTPDQPRDSLLKAFSYMVNQQVQFEMEYGAGRNFRALRGSR